MESTGIFTEGIGRLKSALENAEAVIIGAGAGLSASAGFEYGERRFRALFGDFEERYGFHDMYAGTFFPFPAPLVVVLLSAVVLYDVIVYRTDNFNALAIDTITPPQTEKFDAEIHRIEKYKVWEMKNVYANNDDWWFKGMQDGKKSSTDFTWSTKRCRIPTVSS